MCCREFFKNILPQKKKKKSTARHSRKLTWKSGKQKEDKSCTTILLSAGAAKSKLTTKFYRSTDLPAKLSSHGRDTSCIRGEVNWEAGRDGCTAARSPSHGAEHTRRGHTLSPKYAGPGREREPKEPERPRLRNARNPPRNAGGPRPPSAPSQPT